MIKLFYLVKKYFVLFSFCKTAQYPLASTTMSAPTVPRPKTRAVVFKNGVWRQVQGPRSAPTRNSAVPADPTVSAAPVVPATPASVDAFRGAEDNFMADEVDPNGPSGPTTTATTATTNPAEQRKKRGARTLASFLPNVPNSGSSQGADACGSCSAQPPVSQDAGACGSLFCEYGPICMGFAYGCCARLHQEELCQRGPFCKDRKCLLKRFHQKVCEVGPDCPGLSNGTCIGFHQARCDYGPTCWFKYAKEGPHKCNFWHHPKEKGSLLACCLFHEGYCPYAASTGEGCKLIHKGHLPTKPMHPKELEYLETLRLGKKPCRNGINGGKCPKFETCFFAHDGKASAHIPPADSAPASAQDQTKPYQVSPPEKCRFCFENTGVSCKAEFDRKGRFIHRPAKSA